MLNRCQRFRGFVYHQQARFSPDKKSNEIAVRPRKGSGPMCSRCHHTAPDFDRLAERRFETFPSGGFLVFLLYTCSLQYCDVEPLCPDGALMNFLGPGILGVRRERVAVLICY